MGTETETSTSQAYEAGYERGTNAGSWVFDGNTGQEAIRRVLKGLEEGDPEVYDMQPAPLSGEWAGESLSELAEEYGIDDWDDDTADQFESGYSDGYWHEVERSGRAMLPDPEPLNYCSDCSRPFAYEPITPADYPRASLCQHCAQCEAGSDCADENCPFESESDES